MKGVLDLVLAAQQCGLVENARRVEVTRARAKQSHAVDVSPAGIECGVVSHVHRVELLHGFGEAASVHQFLGPRDPGSVPRALAACERRSAVPVERQISTLRVQRSSRRQGARARHRRRTGWRAAQRDC